MRVICDSRVRCKERYVCGGALVHDYDESECGKCPLDPSAKCIKIIDTEYVLMQNPTVQSPSDPTFGYYTIGLKRNYPNNGYCSCDEFGILNAPYEYPSISGELKFAFNDKESLDNFKGKIVEKEGIKFGIVKYITKE